MVEWRIARLMEIIERSIVFSLAPFCGMALSGTVAAWWHPGRLVRSYIQHFAAGIVFAAVGVEILPDVMHRQTPLAAAMGFALGTASMLLIRAISRRAESDERTTKVMPWALLAAVAVDVFVDGMLIGVGFAAGKREGVLLAVAMTGCSISLGLATSASILNTGNSRLTAAGYTAGIGFFPVMGALTGAIIASQIAGGWMEGLLAFTCAALLYLVTEELLFEAHADQEGPESALTTTSFFAGFLALLITDMVI